MRGVNKGHLDNCIVVVAGALPNLHNNHKGGDGFQVDRKYRDKPKYRVFRDRREFLTKRR